VALKVIRPERSAAAPARLRLLREARALALLHHPNVVTVHDVGTDPEGDQVFIAMELVEGSTLTAWLERPRSWRALRDVFLDAGRGLAAAHAAGIVHRDFKPHNVIVGDERVVVVDFGLARTDADLPDEPSGPGGHDGLRLELTLTGERVGTPHYMSPEQRAGGAITAKADQYAFCVALNQAVLGVRPSAPEAPPTPVAVPRFVTAAIERGLMVRPEERWPSMDALLTALGRTFWTRRRKRLAGAMTIGLVAAVAAGGFTLGQRAAGPPACGASEPLVAALWDDAARGRVGDAFRKTGRPYAEDTFRRVDAGLRARLAGWAEVHHDNCLATHVRHEQSAAMLDLRSRCLGDARAAVSGLVTLLATADAAVLDRATRAVAEVGDPALCADPASLGVGIAGPLPTQGPQVTAMREELAGLSALFELGKWTEVRTAAGDLVARARELGYKPLIARALAQLAHVEANNGESDAAIRDLYDVAQLGTEVGDDDVVATALPWLVFSLGYGKNQFGAADAVYRWATAATARAGRTPLRLSGLYGNRAVVLGRQGDHAGALALYRSLLELESQRRGPDSLGVGWAMKSIGDELVALGHSAEAQPHYERASAILDKLVGPDNPLAASLAISAGWGRLNLFDFAGGGQLLARAVTTFERSLGPDHARVAGALQGLGVALLGQRQLPSARAAIERAIKIFRATEPSDGRNIAEAYAFLGEVAHKEGHPGMAHELAQRALAIDLAVLGPSHEDVGLTFRLDAVHLLALRRTREAREAIDRALAILVKARGDSHPDVGWALLAQGDVLGAEQRPGEAMAVYERALHILEQASGAGYLGLCEPLSRLAAARLGAGDVAGALALAERAVALAGKAPADTAEVARFELARARSAQGADRPGALALARQARAGLAALGFPAEDLPRVDRWLASVSRAP